MATFWGGSPTDQEKVTTWNKHGAQVICKLKRLSLERIPNHFTKKRLLSNINVVSPILESLYIKSFLKVFASRKIQKTSCYLRNNKNPRMMRIVLNHSGWGFRNPLRFSTQLQTEFQSKVWMHNEKMSLKQKSQARRSWGFRQQNLSEGSDSKEWKPKEHRVSFQMIIISSQLTSNLLYTSLK